MFKLSSLLYLLVFVTPLGVWTVIPGTGTTIRPFLGVVLFGFWAANYMIGFGRNLVIPRELKWLGVFLSLVVVTSIIGIDRMHSLRPLATYFQLIALVFIIVQLLKTEQAVLILIWVIALAFLLVGLVQVGTGIGLWDITAHKTVYSESFKRVSSIYDTVGHTGYVMFVSLMCGVSLFKLSSGSGLLARLTSLAIIVVSGLGLVFTVTLSSLAASLVGLPLILLRRTRLSIRGVVIYSVLVLTLLVGVYNFYLPFAVRLQDHYQRFLIRDNVRYFVWTASLEIIKENPVKGVGAGNTEEQIGFYFPDWHPWFGRARSSHNTYLALIGDHGVLGMTTFAISLSMILFRLYRSIDLADRWGRRRLKILCQNAFGILAGSLIVMIFLCLEREDVLWIMIAFGICLVSITERELNSHAAPVTGEAEPPPSPIRRLGPAA